MQVLNQLKNFKNIKKSQALLIGSLLIFYGGVLLSWNYLEKMRDAVFSDMKIAMMDTNPKSVDTSPTNNVESLPDQVQSDNDYVIDYSKYLGVLEIPKIGLKRGFYNQNSRYNDIQYNVTFVKGSSLPDVDRGNLILMAHSGDSYISYFAYLYRLNIGDECFVTYNGQQFKYKIVNIYDVVKNGVVSIKRDQNKRTLTLITCTKDNDSLQTVYIAEYIE